jgi:hypothetical protein
MPFFNADYTLRERCEQQMQHVLDLLRDDPSLVCTLCVCMCVCVCVFVSECVCVCVFLFHPPSPSLAVFLPRDCLCLDLARTPSCGAVSAL